MLKQQMVLLQLTFNYFHEKFQNFPEIIPFDFFVNNSIYFSENHFEVIVFRISE